MKAYPAGNRLDDRPVIAHVIFRLQVGGLENGLVNLINNMSAEKYRHVIICVKEYTDFRARIIRDDVEVYALHKREGNDIGVHYRLWKLLRKIRPLILHTRNIGTIEYSLTGRLAGVKYCIHGEHGRDMTDINGSNFKYIMLRRMLSPFIRKYIALSRDLESWLINKVRIPKGKVVQLYNGVDTRKFCPAKSTSSPGGLKAEYKIGTVGRFSAEKDQLTLVRAFIELLNQVNSTLTPRLILIGDGPLKEKIHELLTAFSLTDKILMPGECNDIPDRLRDLDVFVLPSLGEGISNTILEAMAAGLPVIATSVGGNPELVCEGETGYLIEPGNPEKMAEKLLYYMSHPDVAIQHGKNSRVRAVNIFGIDRMVENYQRVYDALAVI